jgi:hypothetical protein
MPPRLRAKFATSGFAGASTITGSSPTTAKSQKMAGEILKKRHQFPAQKPTQSLLPTRTE